MPTGNFYFSLGADSTTFLLTFYKIYFVNVRKSGDSGQFPLDAKPALVRQPCYEAPVTQWSKVGLAAAK